MIQKKIHQTYANIKKIPEEINENINNLKIKNDKW
jgi:mannosyltransferase OCH1-like enzyme